MAIESNSYTAFAGSDVIVSGSLSDVAAAAKHHLDAGSAAPVHVFQDRSGEIVEVDYRGSVDDVLSRLPQVPSEDGGTGPVEEPRRGPGRPRLGVVAREVTLLPRHWEWLASQPGGASVALRRLVEEARRTYADRDRRRVAQEASLRFMTTMAGNETGFEEATRALYQGSAERFDASTSSWPPDVRAYARRLAAPALEVLDVTS